MRIKFLSFLFVSLVGLVSLTSCETDEDVGYGLSGAFGKSWYGDFGAIDRFGYPLYSEITFMAGISNDHGTGWERTYYEDGTPCDDRRFDWEVSGLDLYLFFDDRTSLYITDYSVTPDMFKGVFENGVPFVLYLERRW